MKSTVHGIVCVFSLIVFTSISDVATANDESFSISRSLSLENGYPCMAANTKGNEVLVVWVRKNAEDTSKSMVYAARCLVKNDGTCKVKKAKLISDPSGTCELRPRAAYNPDDNSYLVVWSTTSGKIKTVKLSKTGRKSGSVNSIENSSDSYPVVAFVPTAQTTAAAAWGGFLLAYANHSGTDQGLYTMTLDSKGAAISQATRISTGYTSQANRPTQIIRDADGTYLIAHIKHDATYGDCAHAARVGADGTLLKNARLGAVGTSEVNIVQLSGTLYLATFSNTEDYSQIQNQLFKKKLRRKGAPFEPYDGQWIYGCCLPKLQNSNYAVQITQEGSYVLHYRFVDSKGKLPYDAAFLGAEGHIISALSAVCLTGTNTIFLAYSVNHGSNDHEIKGRIFEPVRK